MNANDLKEIAAYVSENVEGYDERLSYALTIMDHSRCPLNHADPRLFNEIWGAIDDYCIDNDLDADEIDIEDIIFM